MNVEEVIIIGGGLAGLTAALDLNQKGKEVLVLEKNKYPHHKVCGEYVSNEVRPYLNHLGVNIKGITSVEINEFHLGTYSGKNTKVTLPLGGFGVSRYVLDDQLYQLAKKRGVRFQFESVQDVEYIDETFTVTLASNNSLKAQVVIGAFGKRSVLDKKLNRPFIQKKSAWLAVKCHYEGYGLEKNVVSLQTFPGGYGGLSQTELGYTNFCYLAKYEDFKKYGNLKDFEDQILSKNKVLRHFLESAKPVFKKPMSIAQISFDKKSAVENHILMSGDTAGLIHPLCGNGMAMAIHSGKIASKYVDIYLNEIKYTRDAMEKAYQDAWNKEFKKRILTGKLLQGLMFHTGWFDLALSTLASSKKILTSIIANTHGKPIVQ